MTARQAAIWLALTLLPGSLFAQVLSEQQLDYLRDQFIETVAESVDGSLIEANTLPVNRIQGLIPASKLLEADPRFILWLSTNTYIQVEIDPVWQAEKSLYATGTPVYTESDPGFTNWLGTNTYSQTSTDYTTNLVFPLVGQTITLYIANGLITNTLTEGP